MTQYPPQYPPPPPSSNGQIVDPRRWNVPAVLAVGMAALACGAVVFYFNSRAEFQQAINQGDKQLNKRIDKVVESVNILAGTVQDLANVGSKVVGKTPEGYHRRDCQDLVNRIETEIAREISDVQYRPENFPANTAILRALHRVDCYDLQGFKSRVASRWNTIVKKSN